MLMMWCRYWFWRSWNDCNWSFCCTGWESCNGWNCVICFVMQGFRMSIVLNGCNWLLCCCLTAIMWLRVLEWTWSFNRGCVKGVVGICVVSCDGRFCLVILWCSFLMWKLVRWLCLWCIYRGPQGWEKELPNLGLTLVDFNVVSFVMVFFLCCFSGDEVVADLFHIYWLWGSPWVLFSPIREDFSEIASMDLWVVLWCLVRGLLLIVLLFGMLMMLFWWFLTGTL